jgi:hypothetical protein
LTGDEGAGLRAAGVDLADIVDNREIQGDRMQRLMKSCFGAEKCGGGQTSTKDDAEGISSEGPWSLGVAGCVKLSPINPHLLAMRSFLIRPHLISPFTSSKRPYDMFVEYIYIQF